MRAEALRLTPRITGTETMKLVQSPAATSFRADDTSPDIAASRRAFLKLGCACCAMLAAPFAFGQTPSPEVAKHLAAAKEAAGSDLGAYLALGQSADPNYKQEPPDIE